jgi:hypothetical protein
MSTGACGINCDVCRLNLKGICSTCGPGTSDAAACKLAAQHRILGSPCAILACAQLNHIDHCMRDCSAFPCDNFATGPYPYSKGFLSMQTRRYDSTVNAYAPDGSHLDVDAIYWESIIEKDLMALCNWTFFEPAHPDSLQFRFLNEVIRIDLGRRTLLRRKKGKWIPWDDPLLTLATVMYLNRVEAVYPMGRDIVGSKDLKEGHFFAGPHELRTDPLLTRFQNDLAGFKKAGAALGGKAMEMADAAYQLLPFPRVPLYFLLWLGDEEFKPRLQVLFDRSIENFLAADAIWALVNRVAMAYASA